ncbi:MAG: hypothetical protein LQ339_005908 [Xanthoria mediterranea]|nr:MAG: hypothetical protein LQ339_005908 [Xanthoria mediterranea]
MSTSVGSDIFAFLAIFLVGLLVLLLLRRFLPLRSTPAYVLVPIFLALFLPVSIILLLPIDLASSLRTDDEATRGVWLPETLILLAWRITYWLTFALTWFILPLLGEYIDSGYRTPKDRILYSLRSNGRYQLIVLGCAFGGLVYVFLQNGFKGTSVKALVMAIQSQAPVIDEKLKGSINALEEIESQLTQLRQRKNGISRDHQEWIEELSDSSSLPESRLISTTSNAAIPAIITDRYLAELSRKLNRARHKRLRFIDTWDRLVQHAVDTQAILDASASKRLEFGKPSPYSSSVLERVNVLTPYTRYILHYHILSGLNIFLAAILALASIAIIWSELVKYIAPKLSIIRFTVVFQSNSDDGKVHFPGQIMASCWMSYMCIAALASFGDVKVWGNRALVKRNTYGESATWYAGQVAKLTVPLAYNFLTFLPPDTHRETTFYKFLGQLINLTPLGKGFDFFFPIFVLFPVCATLFNIYGRVKGIFRFDLIEDDDDGAGENSACREGRALIEREVIGQSRLRINDRDAGPSSQTPYRDNALPSTTRQTPTSSTHQQQPPPTQSRLAAATAAAESEDENFFQGFAHRVRNTIDTMERPEWFTEGKRPKWMGGAGSGAGESGRAEAGRGLGRWFGGRPEDGRVRL